MMSLKRGGKRQAELDKEVYRSLVDFIESERPESVDITRKEAHSLYMHLLRKYGTAPVYRRFAEGIRDGSKKLKGVALNIIKD